MVAPFIDQRTRRLFTDSMRRLAWTFHLMATDEFDCWRVNRGPGWADNTSVEAQERIAHGVGKLLPNSAGGMAPGLVIEGVLAIESPYRLRALSFDPVTQEPTLIREGHLLAITGHSTNDRPETGYRLFRVDMVKRGSDDALMMDVYLTELFNVPVPGAG
jgi:hypothetical protein